MRWLGLDRLLFTLLRRVLALFVRPKVLPQPLDLEAGGPEPVCYVLERNSLSDLLTLDMVCLQAGLPRPNTPLPALHERRSVLMLRTKPHWYSRRTVQSARLQRLTALAAADATVDARLVPVCVFWGRSPDRERSLFKALFSEGWGVAGWLHRLFVIVIHGRNTLVQFSRPLSLRKPLDEGVDPARAARRTHRLLRVHFRDLRIAVIGPDLSHRRTQVSRIVRSASVRHAVAREVRSQGLSRRKGLQRARKYATEIAADYSYTTVRVLDRLLEWWWNQRYEGIDVHNLSRLKSVVEGNEVIYVPCHRSHVDYLLLSYVLYRAGLVIPHIAAGINLNLPVIGAILRRGGAFFMRRSFRGNRLYAAVFNEYLSLNMARGVALEYFVEGTRSRTGKLLEPKLGMLSMTVRSYLRDRRRPVVFVPVYIGYEHLFEASAYVGELSGEAKKKESLFDLVSVVAKLRGKYGRVSVNFGDPLFLDRLLDQESPGWRHHDSGGGERSVGGGDQAPVTRLANEVMTRINAAAVVNPMNLLALTLLSTAKNAMLERDLRRMLDLYGALLRSAPYSAQVQVTSMSGEEMIAHADRMGLLRRQRHSLGDVLSLSEEDAVLLTYLRNNVLHLVALPSLIACCFLNNRSMRPDKLVRLVTLVYPFLRSELFLHWREGEVGDVVRTMVDELVARRLLARERDGVESLATAEGAGARGRAPAVEPVRRLSAGGGGGELWAAGSSLVAGSVGTVTEASTAPGELVWRPRTGSIEAVQLSVLAQAMLQTLERYYLALALLLKHGPGALTQAELESLCQQMAQRMAMLHGLNAPEFFARPLFRNFIRMLRQRGVLQEDEDGTLTFDDAILRAVEADAKLVLSEQIRHSVLQVTHA